MGAQQIASRWYWTPVQADQRFPAGSDVAVAGLCFHPGEARIRQGVADSTGVKVDGDIGPGYAGGGAQARQSHTLMDTAGCGWTGWSNYETNKNGWSKPVTHPRGWL